jgi:tetratricopeptide (TPR) repeat protein
MLPDIDYELEVLQIRLDAGFADALDKWQSAFEEAHKRWRNNRARRLLQILKASPMSDAALRIVKYYEAVLLVNLGEWSKAKDAFEQSISLCRRLGDSKGELRAVNGLANLLRRSADHLDSAMEIFDAMLQSDLPDETSQIILRNGMGLLLYEKGSLGQAQACFDEVVVLAKKTGNRELLASALHNLGSIAWTQGRLQEAGELLREALDIQHDLQNTHGEAETLNSLGLVEEGIGQWKQAVETYQLALEKIEQSGDYYGQAQVLINLGNLYSLRHEIDRALSCLEQAYEIAKEVGNPRLQGQSLTALGDTYRINGELERAVEYLRQGLETKIKSGESRSLKHNWLSLGAAFHQLKQPQNAQSAYENALKIAREQNDRRMTVFILVAQCALSTAQEKFQEAKASLVEAKALALEGKYHDCLAWIYEQEGDLELLSQEPNAAHILEAYSLALWHACQFNEYELEGLIQRLSRFWIAHAEDGQGQVSLWFCDSIIYLWQNSDEMGECPIVVEEFTRLRDTIARMIDK